MQKLLQTKQRSDEKPCLTLFLCPWLLRHGEHCQYKPSHHRPSEAVTHNILLSATNISYCKYFCCVIPRVSVSAIPHDKLTANKVKPRPSNLTLNLATAYNCNRMFWLSDGNSRKLPTATESQGHGHYWKPWHHGAL